MPLFVSKKGAGVGPPTTALTGLTLTPSSPELPHIQAPPKRLNIHGLHLLNPPRDDPSSDTPPILDKYPIDIVAIHGLRGDAYGSWTDKKSGAFWLRDFLPKEFPGARIFSFGYAADIWSTGGAGTVEWYGRSLMQSLKAVRISAKEKRRPIIFICHSMGGIVVKQAIITAKIDSREFEEISRKTAAILFLATPHCGSNAATTFKTIAAIANSSIPGTRLWGKFESPLLKTLEKDSVQLQEISRNFRNQIGGIKIASFVEGKCERGAKERIVDESSGLMNIDGEEQVQMTSCNHRGICRFPNMDDDSYRNVLRVLWDYANLAVNKVIEDLNSEELPCLQSLAFPEIDQRRQQTDRAHHNTCNWILRHPSYHQWQQGSHSLLWIKGKPGSGKSTLMAFIYRHLQTPGSHLTLDFFFHGRGTQMQKSEEGMFRSLVHNLFLHCYEARAPILEAFQNKKTSGKAGSGWGLQLKELQELFLSVVTQISKKREVTIFVDALDEAGSEVAGKLLGYFHHLNEEFISMDCCAKICISCRYYPVVSLIPGLEIRLEDENAGDIRAVVQDQLLNRVTIRTSDPAFAKNCIYLENTIVTRASGLFQWISLVMPMVVEALNDGHSFDEVHQLLEAQSSELFTLYEHILKNIIKVRNSKRTLRLMQWVCLAARPLSLTELRFALACSDSLDASELELCEKRKDFVESDERMLLLTKSLSGGLVEVKYSSNGYVVQLVHQSVNDFLLSGGLEFLTSISYPIDGDTTGDIIGPSQQLLSLSCVNYLKIYQPTFPTVLKPPPVKWTRETPKDIERAVENARHQLPFLEYATKSIFIHAEKAESQGTTQRNLIQQFNTTPHLFDSWTKAYQYLKPNNKPCPECPSLESTLIHAVASFNLPSTLQTLLESGVSVHDEDYRKSRPLHFAARWGHIKSIQLLLDNGADISAQNISKSTALELAAGHGHLEAVQLLLDSGANIDQMTDFSGSALQHAACKGYEEIVRMLLRSGANVNAQGERGGNALQAAAAGGHETVVFLLLDSGADVNAQGGTYGNALQAAALHIGRKSLEMMKMLVQRGAEINARGGVYETVLQCAASRDCPGYEVYEVQDAVRFLVDCGADVGICGGEYGNALQAAREGEVIEMLLKLGAKFNTSGPHIFDIGVQEAAYKGDEELIKNLIGKPEEEYKYRGFFYRNLLPVAKRLGYQGVADLILANGGVDFEQMESLVVSDASRSTPGARISEDKQIPNT